MCQRAAHAPRHHRLAVCQIRNHLQDIAPRGTEGLQNKRGRVGGATVGGKTLVVCSMFERLASDDVLMVTRFDRLARSISGIPLNTLAAIADKKAGFRSLGDTWADTTTPHGRCS